jgi:uncharacterized glyoxalase superfamily protein PhnB
MVSPVPDGLQSIIPYIIVPDSIEAIAFYEKAFGATQTMHMAGPEGQGTMHAEVRIFGGTVMLSDENPQWEMVSAKTLGQSPVNMMFYCENVDEAFAKAVAAGCEVKFPVADMFWGDRMAKVVDPFGYQWSMATHVEDVPENEMPARQQKWMEEMAAQGK